VLCKRQITPLGTIVVMDNEVETTKSNNNKTSLNPSLCATTLGVGVVFRVVNARRDALGLDLPLLPQNAEVLANTLLRRSVASSAMFCFGFFVVGSKAFSTDDGLARAFYFFSFGGLICGSLEMQPRYLPVQNMYVPRSNLSVVVGRGIGGGLMTLGGYAVVRAAHGVMRLLGFDGR